MQSFESDSQVLNDSRFVTIEGRRFHYFWLRDNCLCPRCREAKSFQRFYDISESPVPPRPLSVAFRDDEVVIEWDEEPVHQSTFSIRWLMNRAYDPEPTLQFDHEIILWDREWLEANTPEWQDASSCGSGRWLDQLSIIGFTRIQNIELENLKSLMASFGPVHPLANYDLYSTVKPASKSKKIEDLGISPDGHGLSPHTDMSYIDKPTVVQLLYAVENEASGGETILVDGFQVAKDFKQKHPEYFEVLATVPVEFHQFLDKWDYLLSNRSTILVLDENGELSKINFSHKNLVVNAPFNDTEKFYEAFICFFNYLKNPEYQYCFRLEAGECVLALNNRVLHGRNAYDPNSGPRHLKTSYMTWDYFRGKRNFQKLRSKLLPKDFL